MTYTTLLIDLDETVYSSACGVWEAISVRMEQYMHEQLHLPLEEIPSIRKTLYQQYGTTLHGLQMTRHVDAHEFNKYVHDVPLEKFLKPDPELRDVLLQYSQRKLIFTNADRNHATRVLHHLHLDDCFDAIIDIYDIAPYCKPMPEAFLTAVKITGCPSAEECVFIDDSPRNLSSARQVGMFTIQVGQPKPGFQHPLSTAHVCISRLHDLPSVLSPQ